VKELHQLGWVNGCLDWDYICVNPDTNDVSLYSWKHARNLNDSNDKCKSSASFSHPPYFLVQVNKDNIRIKTDPATKELDLWDLGLVIYWLNVEYIHIGVNPSDTFDSKTPEEIDKIMQSYVMPTNFRGMPDGLIHTVKEYLSYELCPAPATSLRLGL